MSQSKTITWTSFKACVSAAKTHYFNEDTHYNLFGESTGGGIIYEVSITKSTPEADDFEAGYKVSGAVSADQPMP